MRVLVSGPVFHDYIKSIAQAFEQLGCKVSVLECPEPNRSIFYKTKRQFLKKITKANTYQKLSEIDLRMENDTIIGHNNRLIQYINENEVDLLLVIKGRNVLPETLKKIQEKTKITLVNWCYDSALRLKNVIDGGHYYDLFYAFEPTDIPKLRKYKIAADLLPMGYDPSHYKKIENTNIRLDISFVGGLNNYPKRKKMLEEIIKKDQGLRIGIWLKAWTWYNPLLQYEYKLQRRKLGKHINNYNVAHDQVNEIYNSSRICLNIHHLQSKQGLNPRTFEILGAGGFELVDYKALLENLFELEKEIVCYRNEKELFEKIDYYLSNEKEREKIAEKGYKRVRREHTFKHRAEKILKDYKDIN